MSDAVRAAEASKERESGVAAANKLLSEEYVPQKKQPAPEAAQNLRPERYSDDPFYLGSSSSSSSSRTQSTRPERRDSGGHRESAAERAESFSARRRAGKKGSARSGRRAGKKDDGNADLLGIDSTTSKVRSALAVGVETVVAHSSCRFAAF